MNIITFGQKAASAETSGSTTDRPTGADPHPTGCRCTPCIGTSIDETNYFVVPRVLPSREEEKNSSTTPQAFKANSPVTETKKVSNRGYSESGQTSSVYRSYERPRRLKTDDRRRTVRRLTFGELGSASLANQSQSATLSGVVSELNLLAEGDDVVNRTGRLVDMDSSELRWNVELQNPASFTFPGYIRIMLVWDKYPNQGATGTPTMSQILTTTSVGAQVHSLPVFGQLDRFEFLYDKVFSVGSYTNSTDTAAIPEPHGVVMTSLKGKYSQYSNANSGYTDLVHGGLLLVTCGSLNNGAGYNVVFDHRLRFSE